MALLISAFKWLQILSRIRIVDGCNEKNNLMQEQYLIAPTQTWAWQLENSFQWENWESWSVES